MANPSADFPNAIHSKTDVSQFGGQALGGTAVTHTQLEGKQEEELAAIQGKLGTGVSAPKAGQILASQADNTSLWVDPNPIISANTNVSANTAARHTHANKASLDQVAGINTGDQTISDATISTSDIITNNVSTSKHGFAPKLPGNTTTFLRGDGAFATPTDTAASWGNITGALSSQTDLQAALDSKASKTGDTVSTAKAIAFSIAL